ncbi:MAG: choice-of-anchor L domain-containing protein [Crocinitomicaceae bacterium]|nr:choice-of-anchor L domain-containing protein [Crocinitomicaceae bacterium]
MKSLLSLLIIIVSSTIAFGQIIVDPTPSPTQLVQNNLIGNGVSVSNITFSGQTSQIGSFDGSSSNIGLPFGLVMSSGNVVDCIPPAQPSIGQFGGPGDPDLLTVAQSVTSNPASGNINVTQDAAILEFDFIPIGDSVRFNFVFASEEYLTYVNTQYNDAFGFFISGPGFAGPFASPAGFPNGAENLAVVPGTAEPITISTIHPGLNAAYYIDNPTGTTHSFNGFTIPISIEFEVVCGQTYHFKFAVSDCQDDFLDTAVFLEGASFSSEAVQVAVATVTGDTAVYEGCTDADFIFSRPVTDTTDTLIINYNITGTATEGVDFGTLVNPVTFLPGEDTVILNLLPTADGVIEPGESVTITAFTISPCGDTIVSSGTVWIFDEPNITIDEQDTTLLCSEDSLLVTAIASGGFEPFTYSWVGSSSTTSNAYVSASTLGPVEYYVTATDQCGYSQTDTVTVTLNQTLLIDSLISYPSAPCNPTGAVAAFVSGQTGQPLYTWTGPGSSTASIDATVWQNISPGWYYFTVTDNVCQLMDSVLVDVDNPPVASFSATPNSGCSPVQVLFTNNSQNAVSYEWNFGGGNIINVNSSASQTQTFTNSTPVTLIATDAGGCADTTAVTITVSPCGCTDPTAENYNPTATIDDGSCTYPVPIVDCPNIFTPNDDGANDLFELYVENALEVELIILNRWGSVMFEKTITGGSSPTWDGTSPGGSPAVGGTYFVKYIVTGVNGDSKIEGHNFLQLVRD